MSSLPHPPGTVPTGTVVFVFSDIEGSTGRWERDRDAMTSAVRRHDALVREAIEAHNGYVFKTVGDAFCTAFARPDDALAASLAAQRAIAAEDFSAVGGLRVRMAVHAGTADEREGDYFGPAVNRVARLLSIGHGGQVLVSGAVAELVHGVADAHGRLRDLGLHQLKDLARSEHVYQLVAPDLPHAFPALRSLDALPNNLPRQLTSFLGREDEVALIASLIAESPLVTLVGTGGAGKTRCAVQAGALLLDGTGDGVWLVELAPISDGSLIASTIAQALGVPETVGNPILETLVAYLKRKRLLLILDNCEHLIAEARTVAATILRSCPEIRILATSRESLTIAGEHIYRMPSLSLPPAGEGVDAERAARYGAISLFVDRARASDSHFVLTDENAPFVADVCRRLDGIPLALELAAARVKVLSPQQLARKLDERFRVLTGGDRSALPRQQTMRALIDWSYDLLSERERAVFRTLAIFAGSFTLGTASAVVSDDRTDEFEALDVLSSLVDKSLLQPELAESGTRYRLLESTRHYAREKLEQCGEHDRVARRHAVAYLALAERMDAAWDSTPDLVWFAQAQQELENLRAALEWSLTARGDTLVGMELVGALYAVWNTFSDGLSWVRAAHERIDASTPAALVARLHHMEASRYSALNRYQASYTASERALAHYRELNDARGIAEAQRIMGRILVRLDRAPEGEAILEEALATARRLGLRKLSGTILSGLASARYLGGDTAGGRVRFAEALTLAKATGAARLAAQVAANLAELEFRDGNVNAALASAQEALAHDRALNDQNGLVAGLTNGAAYAVALARFAEARTYVREAISTARGLESELPLTFALLHLGAVGALRQSSDDEHTRADRKRAALLFGFVAKRIAALESTLEFTEQQEYDRVLVALRDALGEEQLALLMTEGSAWDEDHAVEQALLV